MDKIKKYISLATLSFTLISCVIYALAAIAIDGESTALFILEPGNAFLLLVLSLALGFSFAVFDIKGLPNAAKRLIHIALTFAISILGVFALHSGEGEKAMLVFVACFVFLIVYFLCMLICTGLRKFEKFVKDEKN